MLVSIMRQLIAKLRCVQIQGPCVILETHNARVQLKRCKVKDVLILVDVGRSIGVR